MAVEMMIDILLLMGNQTNKQSELISVDPILNKFKLNGIDVSLVPDGTKIKGKVNDCSKVFAMFINNKDFTERDIKREENKNKTISKEYRL